MTLIVSPKKAGGADADAEGDAMKKPAATMRRPSATSSTAKKRPAGAMENVAVYICKSTYTYIA